MPSRQALVRVLGIDPGSVITGYGLVESDGTRTVYCHHGHIRTRGESFAERLGHIHTALLDVVDEWHPDEVAIEQVFVSNNALSALKLGQARGAAISAVVAKGLPVSEYAARSVKQVVTGAGSADKARVQAMVKGVLQIDRPLQVDAADGLAIAICHAHSRLGPVSRSLPSRRRTRGRGLRR